MTLLIGTLVLGIIAASTWTSYLGVKHSALEVANQRLLNLTQQLTALSGQTAPVLLGKTFTAANDPAVRTYFQTPSASTRPAALAVLQQFAVAQDPNSLRVELWSIQPSLILADPPDSSLEPGSLETEFKQSNTEPFKSIGLFRQIKNAVVFPVVAAAKNDAGQPIGYLVRWRRVSATPARRKQFADLLGSQAVLYFGNSPGDVWTDLDQIVPQPPTTLDSTLQGTQYKREGTSFLAAGQPVSGTPWFILVEFPEEPFLAEPHRFLRRMLLVDLVMLAVGVTGAVVLSRSITRPLNLLTKAAGAISSGDYFHTVAIHHNDEVGALGDAFSVMAVKVRDSQSALEQQVEALRESEQRFQTVIENLHDGLVISDLNSQLLHWNKAALEMHGFGTLEECLISLPYFAKIFELSDLEGTIFDLNEWPLSRIIRGEQLTNLEVRIRRLDTDWNRIFSYAGNIVREATGRLVAFVTISDITERKRAEEENRLLALIVESAREAVVGKNLDGTITSWNKAAEKLYGYQAEEVLGRSVGILAPLELADELKTILERLRRGEIIDHFETERVAKDGKRIFVSLTISPISEKLGAVTGWSTIARDITQSKLSELALQASEVRYRRLFESAKDGILILDADSGKIVDVNPFVIEMLGVSKEALLGQRLWELGPFKDIVASKLAFADLQERGYMRYENLPLQDRDGIVRQVEFVSNSYLAGEKRVIQCNIRDITERKLADEELRQTNQSLEQALTEVKAKTADLAAATQQLWQASKLATMGELAASIAHELNNPLATISLRIESLEIDLAHDEQKSRIVAIIAGEVERMGKLIGGLLQFSRRSHQQISTLDIREELESSLELVEYHLRSRNIEVVREFDPALQPIQADCQQLRQVFLNLLTNASDAMPEGGTLIVRAGPVDMESGESGVSVELSDSGPGISPANLEKIWEPFFTTKESGKGTGLGLAISRRAIEEHKGTIQIKSTLGKGTTVIIVLPVTNGEFSTAIAA